MLSGFSCGFNDVTNRCTDEEFNGEFNNTNYKLIGATNVMILQR